MPDLVVNDELTNLASDLNELVSQFEGALDFQNDFKGLWGQLNANLSMGDFADNWTTNRNKMVEDMKKLSQKVTAASDGWEKADVELYRSLEEHKA